MGMTRLFDDTGNSFPVTVLKLEENQVVKVLDYNKNGYFAIQVGTGKVKTKNIGKTFISTEDSRFVNGYRGGLFKMARTPRI